MYARAMPFLIAALLIACRSSKEHASRDTPTGHGDPTPTVEPPVVTVEPPTTQPTNAAALSTTSLPVGGNIPNVEQTIAKLSPRFKRCYNQGLQSDPNMSGKMIISINVAADGRVLQASKTGGTGLSAGVETCILGEVRSATFDPPGGSGATIQVPVTFVKSQ